VSRFSQLYIEQSSPLSDSERARRRIGKLLESLCADFASLLGDHLDRELGISSGITYHIHCPRFFAKCHVRDLLDSITLARNFLRRRAGVDISQYFEKEVRRIFEEEHLAYSIDDHGIVHPAIDKEFQRNRSATVAGLQSARYGNSLVAFERVSEELTSVPPNGKEAWRAVFSAVEGLFRLMFPAAPHLNAGAAETHLAPLIQKIYATDPAATRAATRQLASFRDWVDSSHNYRHEQGSKEPTQPPIDLAILAISNGTGFLRWLLALDQQRPS
jgi:hypothetical protein